MLNTCFRGAVEHRASFQ